MSVDDARAMPAINQSINYQITKLANYQMQVSSLGFTAERAAIGSSVERLSAVPAETRQRCFARLEARVNLLHVFDGWRRRLDYHRRWARPRLRAAVAGGEDLVEQVCGALIACADLGCHRLDD